MGTTENAKIEKEKEFDTIQHYLQSNNAALVGIVKRLNVIQIRFHGQYAQDGGKEEKQNPNHKLDELRLTIQSQERLINEITSIVADLESL